MEGWMSVFRPVAMGGLFFNSGVLQSYWPIKGNQKIEEEFGLIITKHDTTVYLAIQMTGHFVSSFVTCYMADWIGRKKTLLIFSVLDIVGWVIFLAAPVVEMLCFSQFLLSMWTGIVGAVVPMYVGETVERRFRGAAGAVGMPMYGFGVYYTYKVGWEMNYTEFALTSALTFPLFISAALIILPESPYFLIKKGRTDSARKNMRWLSNKMTDEEYEAVEESVKDQMLRPKSFFHLLLLEGPRMALFLVTSLNFVRSISSLEKPHQDSAGLTECVVPVLVSQELENAFYVIGATGGIFAVEIVGRKATFIASCTACFVSEVVISILYLVRYTHHIHSSILDSIIMFVFWFNSVSFCVGVLPVPHVLKSEVFPMNLKSKGLGVAIVLNSIVAGLYTSFFILYTEENQLFWAHFIRALSSSIGIVCSSFFLIETKNKSLDEIQKMLSHKS